MFHYYSETKVVLHIYVGGSKIVIVALIRSETEIRP